MILANFPFEVFAGSACSGMVIEQRQSRRPHDQLTSLTRHLPLEGCSDRFRDHGDSILCINSSSIGVGGWGPYSPDRIGSDTVTSASLRANLQSPNASPNASPTQNDARNNISCTHARRIQSYRHNIEGASILLPQSALQMTSPRPIEFSTLDGLTLRGLFYSTGWQEKRTCIILGHGVCPPFC